MSYFYHFGPRGEVGAVGYGATLDSEGFIHCSHLHQVLGVADALYADAGPLEIAAIDPELLTSPVVVEDSYGSGESYPHIYGPIDPAAMVAILPFERRRGGGYVLPEGLPER